MQKLCIRCEKIFETEGKRTTLCGSLREKTGCHWVNRLETLKKNNKKSSLRKKQWADIKYFSTIIERRECEKCGRKEKLVVHHKDRSSVRKNGVANNNPENLITLCRACHLAEHREEHLAIKRAKYL